MFESISKFRKYCNSLTEYSRYKTREVNIGDISCGGDNPIRIQSMTTTDTMNTIATVEQTIRMVDAGCEYVRITAPSKLEAENLLNIKNELEKRGYKVPLIADIHFTPNAAEIAARIVEKVRVNPGNYADRKKFQVIEYTNDTYEVELERIRKKFTPLVHICKEYGTAMRIGTNHGSLSDRILSRYGDTPLGMVESALEFVRICEDLDYRQIVLSMKASNPQIMVQAYRLLIQKMEEEEMNYPLHLGVTEAGGGEDGRIKSAVGIGSLLEDGLGDTIRVSLTEDPEFEAPVAVYLVNRYNGRENHKHIKPVTDNILFNPLTYEKRKTYETSGIGGNNVPRVISDFHDRKINSPDDLSDIGYFFDSGTDKWNMNDIAPDILYAGKNLIPFDIPSGLKVLYDYGFWKEIKNNINSYPLFTPDEFGNAGKKSSINFIKISLEDLTEDFIETLRNDFSIVLILETDNLHGMAEQRRAFFKLLSNNIDSPVIIKRNYNKINPDQLRLFSSTDLGSLLIDGFGDGIWIEFEKISINPEENKTYIKSFVKTESSQKIINRISFGILQASRVRISKTEYIACPSCGRTLFDLQETTEKIRKRTEHLKGVKIAIMGCIVNGPGEMADADYGYVGSGVGKITLYKGKDIVKRNVPAENAVDSLIEIIKNDNMWIEPKQ